MVAKAVSILAKSRNFAYSASPKYGLLGVIAQKGNAHKDVYLLYFSLHFVRIQFLVLPFFLHPFWYHYRLYTRKRTKKLSKDD